MKSRIPWAPSLHWSRLFRTASREDLTEKQQEILGRVSEKIKGLADMSKDLLDLSRIESGLISLEKERIDVQSLLSEQTDFYRGKADEKGYFPASETCR